MPTAPELRAATCAAAEATVRAPWQRTRIVIEVAALVVFCLAAAKFATLGWMLWMVLSIPMILVIAGCIAVEVDMRVRRPATALLLDSSAR